MYEEIWQLDVSVFTERINQPSVTIAQLQALCTARGLAILGDKSVLRKRLVSAKAAEKPKAGSMATVADRVIQKAAAMQLEPPGASTSASSTTVTATAPSPAAPPGPPPAASPARRGGKRLGGGTPQSSEPPPKSLELPAVAVAPLPSFGAEAAASDFSEVSSDESAGSERSERRTLQLTKKIDQMNGNVSNRSRSQYLKRLIPSRIISPTSRTRWM